jgi:hypothetical protein
MIFRLYLLYFRHEFEAFCSILKKMKIDLDPKLNN